MAVHELKNGDYLIYCQHDDKDCAKTEICLWSKDTTKTIDFAICSNIDMELRAEIASRGFEGYIETLTYDEDTVTYINLRRFDGINFINDDKFYKYHHFKSK